MGRRVPKIGIRIGNSLTWKTTYHSCKKNIKRTWSFEETLIKKIIKGINRKFNYYVSDMVIHVLPCTESNKPVTPRHIDTTCHQGQLIDKDNDKSLSPLCSSVEHRIKINIKYLVWCEKEIGTKNVHYITSQIISPLLSYIFNNYDMLYDVKVINKSMLSKNAEMYGDYIGDKLMAEPHRDKQIITREFKIATEEIFRVFKKTKHQK